MSKKRVLIVDDEINIRRILQVAFDREGWVAITAEDGHEALVALEKGRVDAVLTDVTMPGMSGYQLQESIAERWPDIHHQAVRSRPTQKGHDCRDGFGQRICAACSPNDLQRRLRSGAKLRLPKRRHGRHR
jgi:CheY-like chemotaxis protein